MSRLSDRLNELNSDDLTLREIEERAKNRGRKISFTTVRTYMNGKHPEVPSARALKALAAAFDVPVEDLEAAARYTGREPFEADPSSDQLTAPQRDAVNEIIRLLADGNRSRNEQEPRAETPATQHPSTNRREDGSQAERRETPMKRNYDLAADTGRSPDHQSGKTIHRRYTSLGEESQVRDDE